MKCLAESDRSSEFPQWAAFPGGHCTFALPTRLAMTTVRPFSEIAGRLRPGDPLRLQAEPENPRDPCAVRVLTEAGQTAGYLYAQTAGWMSILLQAAPPRQDRTQVCVVLRTASDDPTAKPRRRYPIVTIQIRLDLDAAWPLYTIAAMVGFRGDAFAEQFNLADNPWLQPLLDGDRLCHQQPHDMFRMPRPLVDAWRRLTSMLKP